jgi:hypothetical protein
MNGTDAGYVEVGHRPFIEMPDDQTVGCLTRQLGEHMLGPSPREEPTKDKR